MYEKCFPHAWSKNGSASGERVAAIAGAWKEECRRLQQTAGRGTFVPLSFAPGEAFQFDWSEDFAVIGSTRVKLQVAHTKLCYSRAFIVRAYLLQTHEMLFDAHTHAFRALGGVPRRGIYDNMSTAVDKVGVQAIEQHRKRVRFFSTVELVNALEQEKAQGRSGQIAACLIHVDLVILD